MSKKQKAITIPAPSKTRHVSEPSDPTPIRRLSQSDRHILSQAILHRMFDERLHEIQKLERDLAEEVFNMKVPPSVRELMKKMPPGSFESTKTVNVVAGDDDRRFSTLMFADWKDVPAYMKHVVRVPETSRVGKMLMEPLNMTKEWNREWGAAEAQVGAVLGSVSTLRRLLEVWPEIRPLIPVEWMDKPAMLVPVDAIEKLTALAKLSPFVKDKEPAKE